MQNIFNLTLLFRIHLLLRFFFFFFFFFFIYRQITLLNENHKQDQSNYVLLPKDINNYVV